MQQTLFSTFAEECKALESTAKRTQKVKILADFLKSLYEDEIIPATTFVTGRPFPESDERVLDIGGQMAWKINPKTGQSTLVSKPVTILDVYQTFDQISKASGPGARLRKKI